MIKTTVIDCHGAKLMVPAFLADLWPHDLPLAKWPSFCGVGDGLGDRLVPDKMLFRSWRGGTDTVYISPACFVHDVCWVISPNSTEGFIWANEVFRLNLIALVNVQLNPIAAWFARRRVAVYHKAVNGAIGRCFFKCSVTDQMTVSDPLCHPSVKVRLRRLAKAALGIPDTER